MILSQNSAVRSFPTRQPRDRHARMVRIDHSGIGFADAVDDEWIDVDKAAWRIYDAPVRNAFAGDDERHPRSFFIEGRFSPQATLPHCISVIADVDDARVRRETRSDQRIQHLAGLFVHEAAKTIVTGNGASNIERRREIVIEVESASIVPNEWMVGPLAGIIEQRHRKQRTVE